MEIVESPSIFNNRLDGSFSPQTIPNWFYNISYDYSQRTYTCNLIALNDEKH